MLDLNYNNLSNKAQSSLTTTNHQSTKVSNQKAEMTYSDYILIGNGTFGLVYKAKCDQTNEIVAIKSVYQDLRFNNRELSILSELNNINVIKLRNYFYTNKDNNSKNKYLNVVTDFFPENLSHFIYSNSYQSQNLSLLDLKLYSYQLFHALNYLNCLGICHRDIKPQNILIDSKKKLIKLCDFGSAKKLKKGETNVSYVCSRFYRAPELIFDPSEYSNKIDVWSVCCVICEIVLGSPLFKGENSTDQLFEIIKVLGTPSKNDIKKFNPNYNKYKFPLIKCFTLKEVFKNYIHFLENNFFDLISKLLIYDPEKRLSPLDCLCHPFFDDLRKEGYLEEEILKIIFDFSNEEYENDINKVIENQLIPKWYKNT